MQYKDHNNDEDIVRTHCWIGIVDEKNKWQLYETWQLAANYSGEREILKHQCRGE